MSGDTLISTLIYSGVAILIITVLLIYIFKLKRESDLTKAKIDKAKEEGLHEPVSLHPVIDVNSCIKTGACIIACPEKDIIGIVNGKAAVINTSRCVGHGACFLACPTKAISLHMGTEQRGIDLPHVTEKFETNIPGIYIAGELGGMGLIKNAVKQGEEAVQYIYESLQKKNGAQYDLVIVGAGPAGISASLAAKKHKLRFLTLEQDSLGGTVFSFPRQKIVMTSSMQLPLHGTVRLTETNKEDLLKIWKDVLAKNQLSITEYTKVEAIIPLQNFFKIKLSTGEEITALRVLLATGRRGSPKKLNIQGEDLPKVSYRLLDPEQIEQKEILVVGGGDSAIEAAILLADKNRITLSYRSESFSRIKQSNSLKIEDLIRKNQVRVLFNSSVLEISDQSVLLELKAPESKISITNDLVYIFIGGELPTQFLEKIGIKIKTLKGEAILKHKK